jgi:uncharacterized membrane protein YesL
MGKIFDLDSPFINALNKLADLIWLNILTMVCCIPIITVGASLTALHYVVLKMVKNEEGYITKAFFKSFKQNFKQATLIWLILLAVFIILIGDFVIFAYSGISFPAWMKIGLAAVAILIVFATMHLFPLLSRYENNIRNTYKNSLFVGILNLPKTILMMLCWVIPIAILIFFNQILPVVFLLGISGPAFLNALLYKKSFQRFEPEEETAADEEWSMEPVDADGEEKEDITEQQEASIESMQ